MPLNKTAPLFANAAACRSTFRRPTGPPFTRRGTFCPFELCMPATAHGVIIATPSGTRGPPELCRAASLLRAGIHERVTPLPLFAEQMVALHCITAAAGRSCLLSLGATFHHHVLVHWRHGLGRAKRRGSCK